MSPDHSEMHVTGKGSKERLVYLNESCKEAIENYIKVRPTDADNENKNALFLSGRKKRISVQTVQWLIYKHLAAAGFESKHLSVHKLRHTAATLMYTYGNTDVKVLKDILGHESIATTEIYTHLSSKQIKQAMMNNPLNKKHNKKDNAEE